MSLAPFPPPWSPLRKAERRSSVESQDEFVICDLRFVIRAQRPCSSKSPISTHNSQFAIHNSQDGHLEHGEMIGGDRAFVHSIPSGREGFLSTRRKVGQANRPRPAALFSCNLRREKGAIVYFRTGRLPEAFRLPRVAAWALALGALLPRPLAHAQAADAASHEPAREVAVTFDDLPGVVAPGDRIGALRAREDRSAAQSPRSSSARSPPRKSPPSASSTRASSRRPEREIPSGSPFSEHGSPPASSSATTPTPTPTCTGRLSTSLKRT